MVVAVFASCTPAAQEKVEDVKEEVKEEVKEAVEEKVEEVAEAVEAELLTLEIGFYADAADSYYQIMKDAMIGCADLDEQCDWTVDYQVGQSTATEQITAVENFITAGYDVIVVIQNSVDATSECIAKCVDAGIPYFGAAHDFSSADNCADAAGSCCFDFVQAGVYTGEYLAEQGATKIINIQGVLGQGSAAGQTRGLLEGLENGGAVLGAEIDDIMTNESNTELDGSQTVEVVYWAAGNWAADPAQKAMADAITALGADGFDAVYVQNNPMMEYKVKIEPGKTYILLFDVCADAGSSEGRLNYVLSPYAGGTPRTHLHYSGITLPAGRWQTLTGVIRGGSRTSGVADSEMYVNIYCKKYEKGENVYFDNVRIYCVDF